ncbi:MAG: hypothetical protein JWO14_2972 [Solirubrobacterales bacterium]|nr:hypothetical protein [Solirubrobacterales bacterium]
MRSLVYDARKLQQSLTWIDAIALPALDLGTRYFIELAGRRLVSPSVSTVLVPAFEASYSTYSDPYSKIVKDWGDPATIEHDHVAIVFFRGGSSDRLCSTRSSSMS